MGHLETWFDEYQRRFNSIRKELISKMFNEFNHGRLEDKVVNDIEKFILSYFKAIILVILYKFNPQLYY